jgi:hypothetical protein
MVSDISTTRGVERSSGTGQWGLSQHLVTVLLYCHCFKYILQVLCWQMVFFEPEFPLNPPLTLFVPFSEHVSCQSTLQFYRCRNGQIINCYHMSHFSEEAFWIG